MRSEEPIASSREFIAEQGPWTAQEVQSSDSIFTRSASDPAGCSWPLPVLHDFIRTQFHELRIGDLG